MNNPIHYITSNPMKRRTVERFMRQHAPSIQISTREVSFHEPQTLDENKVIKYKAGEAWQMLQRPLIVDDAGFYIDEFPKFPGPLAKPTVMSLGWDGMLRLAAPSYRATIYCRLGYVDENGILHHFRGKTSGVLDIEVPPSLVERRGVYALLRPDESTHTIAEMAGTSDVDKFSPRARALRAFIEYMTNNGTDATP
ncbi:non-canonical purine NTP pyrophosphatase [Candidatus Dependentiae bacterium]